MRSQLLAAVRARLQRIEDDDNPALALESEAVDDARRLSDLLDEDVDDEVDYEYLLGWLHWYRYLALPEGQDDDALNAAIHAFTISFITGVEGIPELLQCYLADHLEDTAEGWLQRAPYTEDRGFVSLTVSLWQRIVDATPIDHPDRPERMANAAYGMQIRFERSGEAADVDSAVRIGRRAVEIIPAGHPDQARSSSNLGNALRLRFDRTGVLEDLEEAVRVGWNAVRACPVEDPDRAACLSNLGLALRTRFQRNGCVADLDEAVRIGREAVRVASTDDVGRAGYLSYLGSALQDRFGRTGSTTDLDEAIRISREAVREAERTDQFHRAGYLSNLSATLQSRFERTGSLVDLNDAVLSAREAVQATPDDHPDQVVFRTELGLALQTRFERFGAVADLDEAVRLGREVIRATPDDHPDRAMLLSNVAGALQERFGRAGRLADLDEMVRLGREAVAATPADHPDRARWLSNSSTHLKIRFTRLGALEDLDEAIRVGREAITATPADHVDRVGYLAGLSITLWCRFQRVGALTDLDDAITLGREALRTTPADHPGRARKLANLSGALHDRFGRTGALADLEEAITVGRDGVRAVPDDHPDRSVMLSNLGYSLRTRFEQVGGSADLDEAIMVGHLAVRATPVDHPGRSGALSNLGTALAVRYEQTGTPADLEQAISTFREALLATPSDHPDQALPLGNLGDALQLRFERLGAHADLDEAFTLYLRAAETGSLAPSDRIRMVWPAATLIARSNPAHASDLFETAVRLLPGTASRPLHRGDKQHALRRFAGLASDAAAMAFVAHEADPTGEDPAIRALQLLELGRGVLLSQALDTRSDLSELRARQPALAARFVELRDHLDQENDTSAPNSGADVAAAQGAHRSADRHHLAALFEATVAEVRRLVGFETFMLPHDLDQLMRCAEQGPVVVINVSRYRSDALLVRPAGITSVPLPDLTPEAVRDRVASLHQAVDPDADSGEGRGADDTLHRILEWLWDVVAWPVLAELGHRCTPVSGTPWPRLWWAPGGLLGSLPVHAAGYHREPSGPDGARRTVLDRVISSYTPTVRALGHAQERSSAPVAGERALVVAMPTTPDIDSPLHHVAREADLVRSRFRNSTLLIEDPGTTADPPTKAAVLAHLEGSAVAHFACHSRSHQSDPSQSHLLLHDHNRDSLTVASLAPVRLEQARLAYLSACRTAYNPSVELADEVIHLTTAFQLVGYAHVVGTLWEINDGVALAIAGDFYAALAADDTTIDTRGAAEALHHAVRRCRDWRRAAPSLWAAYLHAGA